jgi:pimeloyl-ACP methyl ester carboxylesterase
MHRGYVSTRWGQLHYRRAGEHGPVVVMLHQTANSSRTWDALIPRLADQFRIYALDTPGFGMSDPPPTQPSFDEYVDVFFEALDSLGIDETSVIGFHTGAGFAAGMAARSARTVSKLVLMGAPVFDEGDDNFRRSRAARAGWQPDPEGEYLQRMWKVYSNPDLWVRHRELTDRLLAGPLAWWASAAVSDTDIRPLLRLIQCPALVLAATKDFMIEKQEEAARLLPNGTLIVLPGEVLLADDKPDEVGAIITSFIAGKPHRPRRA